jgi:hypothetical protein
MKITSIILAHYPEREDNLKRIIADLMAGTVKPDEIIVFVDNPNIRYPFIDERITTISSTRSFLPIIRFAIGSVCDTDYCFFIDDDLSVRPRTLENLIKFAKLWPSSILGLEGSILGKSETPYSNDTPVKRGNKVINVDVIIRTYFVPIRALLAGFELRSMHPHLPNKSLDDVYLCLGNKYLNLDNNLVVPVDEESNLIELPDGGVGQSLSEDHYKNRNIVCKFLKDKYE